MTFRGQETTVCKKNVDNSHQEQNYTMETGAVVKVIPASELVVHMTLTNGIHK